MALRLVYLAALRLHQGPMFYLSSHFANLSILALSSPTSLYSRKYLSQYQDRRYDRIQWKKYFFPLFYFFIINTEY